MDIRSQKSEVRSQRNLISLLVLFSVFCFLFSVIGCGRKAEDEEVSKVPVSVMEIKRGDLKEVLFYIGDIKAQDQIEVYPRVTGKLIENVVKEGDRIKKGDIVAYIDRDEVGFEFEPAPVTSPLEGTVGRVYLDKGSNVSKNVAIAKVVNMDIVKVRIDVVERDLPRVKVGQAAEIKVDAYPDEIFRGYVERVSPVVDLASRTALVEIEISNPDHRLKPGMFARIKILIKEKENVLIISRDAIIREDSSNYVFIVKDDNKVHRQKIEIGLHENNKFEVISGLSEGEIVVTMGKTRLKEGDLVEIITD